MPRPVLWLAVAATCLALAWGCGPSIPPPPEGNLVSDPGFEEGGEAWAYIGGMRLGLFRVSDAIARSGSKSGHLFLDSRQAPARMSVRAASAVHEPKPEAFPATLAGWYRVERFELPEDEDTGLTVNVIVYAMGDPRAMDILRPKDPDIPPPSAPIRGYGIVYRLAGRLSKTQERMQSEFAPWGNLADRVVSLGEPTLGEWVRFELPIGADFEEVWGEVPGEFESLRVMLQVLWMDRPVGADVAADVFFDDLELLPAP